MEMRIKDISSFFFLNYLPADDGSAITNPGDIYDDFTKG